MRESARLARRHRVRLHTHLCETLDEERYTLEHHGLRPVAYMESLGWVADDVWYAHAIHVDDDEIRLFARTGAGACHCPSSNMRLASGIAPVKKYLDAGVRTGLGVDGAASNDGSNLLVEVREAMLLARLKMGLLPPEGPRTVLSTSDPLRAKEWMTARQALEIATRGVASGPLGHRLAGAGQVRRLLHAGPQHDRLRRRAERPGRRRRVLRPTARSLHGGRRALPRTGWADHHACHRAGDRGAQPPRAAPARRLTAGAVRCVSGGPWARVDGT